MKDDITISGGAVIIGEQTITYHSGTSFKSIRIKPTIIRAFGRIEPSKYLLGDHLGNLQGLHLSDPQNLGKITEIQLSHIGEVVWFILLV
jgi:DNA damage-binding protein 1